MIALYSDAAKAQLVEIWRYSRRRWRAARADRYAETIEKSVQRVANGELRPRPCAEIGVGSTYSIWLAPHLFDAG